jgi:hypothetical protein
MAIDTLQAYDKLIAAAIPENQARAQVYITNSSLDNVATKDDIRQLEKDINKIEGGVTKIQYGVVVGLVIMIIKMVFRI